MKHIFFNHVNINSIRNKFDCVPDILSTILYINTLAIRKTKLDDSLSISNSHLLVLTFVVKILRFVALVLSVCFYKILYTPIIDVLI